MTERFYPSYEPDASLASPSHRTLGEALPEADYPDLYRNVRDEGLPYFARVNGNGDVELFLVFESIDAFSDATRDAISVEFKTYKRTLLAVIWTLHDPLEPLGFPLSFDILQEEQRFMALRMVEQSELLIHYLAYSDAAIIHIYSEACTFSESEQAHVQSIIRYLYEAKEEEERGEHVTETEVKEEGLLSVPARTLSDEVLLENGTAYLLDYARLVSGRGDAEAQDLLMNTVQQAILVMRRHSRSEVRESTFTIWVGEREGTLWLFVTPMLYHLFEVVHTSEEEANPFARFLYTLPEYIETVDASPLDCGAFPILRYESGKLYHLELDESDVSRLAKLAEHAGKGAEKYLAP
ncbi:MAG: hypothetical protein ACM32O_20405 [Clostridia bacterium]